MVKTAPMAETARKQRGNWYEFGAKIRTTSFWRMPRRRNPRASLATEDLRSEKDKETPESESMMAGLEG